MWRLSGPQELLWRAVPRGNQQPVKKQAMKSKKSWLVVTPSLLKSALSLKKPVRKSKKSWLVSLPELSQSQPQGWVQVVSLQREPMPLKVPLCAAQLAMSTSTQTPEGRQQAPTGWGQTVSPQFVPDPLNAPP